MKRNFTFAGIALRLWLFTAILFAVVLTLYILLNGRHFQFYIPVLAFIASIVGSVPAFILLLIALPFINRIHSGLNTKIFSLLCLLVLISIPYGIMGAALQVLDSVFFNVGEATYFLTGGIICACLFICSFVAFLVALRPTYFYFNKNDPSNHTYASLFNRFFFSIF